MYSNIIYKVNEKVELYTFLQEVIDKPKKEVKKLLVNKKIKINGLVVTKYNYMLEPKMEVVVNFSKSDLNVLYEDKDILIVDKPAKLLCIDDNKGGNTLYKQVSSYVKNTNKNSKIFIVNRLDKDTSGIVVFAKKIEIKNQIQDNWKFVIRKYVAVVHGKTNDKEVLKSNLVEDKNHFVYSAKEGKLAITEYRTIKRNVNFSWLDINIKTGRKNQIRVQLKEAGHSIKGDKKYGVKNEPKQKRMFLHAYKICLTHPVTNKKIDVESLVPKEFGL